MTKSKKIILIQPPLEDFYFTHKRSVPYGLSLIAAVLEANSFQVEIIDCLAVSKSRIIDYPPEMKYLETYYGRDDLTPFSLFHSYRHYGYSWEHIGNIIQKSGADIAGISSLFTPYWQQAVKTSLLVKEKLPNCVVIAGGHHPTSLPEEMLRHESIDYVIRGEGEYAFTELCVAISQNSGISAIQGVCYKRKDSTCHISEPAVVADPSLFPLPALSLINNRYYSRKTGGCAVITTSRGCPFNCSYCCVSSNNSKYRRRSVKAVLDEIEASVVMQGARFIDFEDENLSLDKNWFLSLLSGISERFRDYQLELRAMNGLFPPSLDDEILEKMRDAGFQTINLSLCSVSATTLKRFSRQDVSQSVTAVVKKATHMGMESVCYIITGAPGQTPEESIEDLIFLSDLDTVMGVSIYYPAPGSTDFNNPDYKPCFPELYSLMRSSAVPVSNTTTRKEALTILRLSRLWNFISALSRKKGSFPEAIPLPRHIDCKGLDKASLGEILCSAFLFDGQIRGIDDKYQIYTHDVSRQLVADFLHHIKSKKGK
jgi:radical SAM superfamily enzyme YgiQ (UPF0313 family)